ncbi:hypothetical protein CPB85DRAFT_1265297 [Mucidula mucida]|nr:hypothetical protein CPB85DRAFT_1265297 [Mucidula mucida]
MTLPEGSNMRARWIVFGLVLVATIALDAGAIVLHSFKTISDPGPVIHVVSCRSLHSPPSSSTLCGSGRYTPAEAAHCRI